MKMLLRMQHEGLSEREKDNSGSSSAFNSASLWLFHYDCLTIFRGMPPFISKYWHNGQCKDYRKKHDFLLGFAA